MDEYGVCTRQEKGARTLLVAITIIWGPCKVETCKVGAIHDFNMEKSDTRHASIFQATLHRSPRGAWSSYPTGRVKASATGVSSILFGVNSDSLAESLHFLNMCFEQ